MEFQIANPRLYLQNKETENTNPRLELNVKTRYGFCILETAIDKSVERQRFLHPRAVFTKRGLFFCQPQVGNIQKSFGFVQPEVAFHVT